jgi:hypothetical protein
MGRKTTGNDLDNAWVRFDSLRVPKSALLNRYGDVINGESIFSSLCGCTGNWTEIHRVFVTDEYVPTIKGVRTMDMIGQRLFTGRVAVAQAALTFTRKLFANTKAYSDGKRCTMRGEERNALSDVPQVSSS